MFHFKSKVEKILSDTHTPVELYLKLRDRFPQSFLLESSDYKSRENSFSFLGFAPIASIVIDRDIATVNLPNDQQEKILIKDVQIADLLGDFIGKFCFEALNLGFPSQGFFGYTSYDAIPLFEGLEFRHLDFDLPLVQYHLFQHLIVFNHFNSELYIISHHLEGAEDLDMDIRGLIEHRAVSTFEFVLEGAESCNVSEERFLEMIREGKHHCQIGDVFQVVLSRRFSQGFRGDEFNVYRALRSINPSPYLFYFDYGHFKIFGSSPEAQLRIQGDTAMINPIAGTFKRTGNKAEDALIAQALSADPKENAEHIMLVDLARNDLSKSSHEVTVERLKAVEYYSHVIHLVSNVTASLAPDTNPFQILGDTYPAGTLSGAPKRKAMEIIDRLEPTGRGFYGGAVGYVGIDGGFNHAIFIRSFLSRGRQLSYQAGCGVVTKSVPELELQEVSHKLSALRKALHLAENI